MKDLLERLEDRLNKKDIKQITINGHLSNMKRIIDNTGIKTIINNNFELIINSIENEKIKPNTKKNRYKSILVFLRDNKRNVKLYNKYLSKTIEITKIIDEKVGKSKYSDIEKTRLVKWEEIKNIKINSNKIDNKLFISFIINDEIFLRLAYSSIKLKNFDEENDNYIKYGILYMNDFKNIKKIGKQTFKLSSKTIKLVNEVDNDYLFKNHKINKSSQTKFIKRLFKKSNIGKEINNNLLRKIYISKFDFNVLNGNELRQISKRMLNSPTTILIDYRKI